MSVNLSISRLGLESSLGTLNQHPSQSIRSVRFFYLRLVSIHPKILETFFFGNKKKNLSIVFFIMHLGLGLKIVTGSTTFQYFP